MISTAIGICWYSLDFICYALIGLGSIKSKSYIRITGNACFFIYLFFHCYQHHVCESERVRKRKKWGWSGCFVLNKPIHTICNIEFSWKSNIILLWLHLVSLYFSPYFNSPTFANNAHFVHIMCSTHPQHFKCLVINLLIQIVFIFAV